MYSEYLAEKVFPIEGDIVSRAQDPFRARTTWA